MRSSDEVMFFTSQEPEKYKKVRHFTPVEINMSLLIFSAYHANALQVIILYSDGSVWSNADSGAHIS